MDREQIFGIALFAIGLICMILPNFSAALILIIIDLVLAVLGINLIYREYKKGIGNFLSNKRFIAGMAMILIALIFFFGFKQTPFIAGVELILIGIIFMLIGTLGLNEYLSLSKLVSTIVLILGITIFLVPFLTGFELKTSTIVIGLTVFVEGILLYLHK